MLKDAEAIERVGEMATVSEETPPLQLLWLKYLSEEERV